MKDYNHIQIEKKWPSFAKATAGKQKDYNHLEVERKWQKEWDRKKVYKTKKEIASTATGRTGGKYFVLDMFPYPSGTGLHVGHPKGYIGSDVFARMKKMQGFNVLHPMGFDSFGLPAEQYAIQTNKHPGKFTDQLVKDYRKQLEILGMSYDWSREVETHKPDFYHWTQWIFLQIYNSWYNKDTDRAESIESLVKKFEKSGNSDVIAHSDKMEIFGAKEWKLKSEKEKQDVLMKYRLAYEGNAEVNWCPTLGTVLANDEIVDSPDGPVSERGGYPVEKKSMRQWFMRITAYAERLLSGLDSLDWSENIKEIQKNWIGKSEGVEIGFQVEGGEKIKVFTTRPDTIFGATFLVISPELAKDWFQIGWKANENIKKYVEKVLNERNILNNKEKTGIYSGFDAINPATKEKIPVWIADYVLGGYGTGAIMAVPADDERDREFATKFKLPIKKNYKSAGFWDFGKKVTTYKMRDAIFARQRYWGEPIPLWRDKEGIIQEIPENKLPLKLPNVLSYKPTGTGQSPLAKVSDWVKKGLETNTMPGWAGSSWYFLRYMDSKNKKAFADKKKIEYWKNVDMYVGGQEHATGHLLYSRFWNKFLKDRGFLEAEEPFQKLKNQGLILGVDGRKMSKRWGNVINPNDVVKTYGADTLRVYEMFMGPFEGSMPWSTENIIGSRRFIERIWRLSQKVMSRTVLDTGKDFEVILNKTIKKVGDDIESFSFNTAISAMMILLNEMEKKEVVTKKDFESFLKILSPFAPHIAEELWHKLGNKKMLVLEKWPEVDTEKMKVKEIKIVIQINGKVRATQIVSAGITEEAIVAEVKNLPEVDKWLLGREIKKVIYVKNKLVNFVVF